jgi:hypothetical protein
MGHSIVLIAMTNAEEIDEMLAKASTQPLKDAAYLLWVECSKLDMLEWRAMPPEQRPVIPQRPAADGPITVSYVKDHTETGSTFRRLKRTHPGIENEEVKQAIVAAMKFDKACYNYFDRIDDEYEARFTRAVELAAKDHPGFTERTYVRTKHYVSYFMK